MTPENCARSQISTTMNHFNTSNQQQQPSSTSLLTDDKEMNQSFYNRKRLNDEYINSLIRFIHDVEETKRFNQKKMAAKVNDPWDALLPPNQKKSNIPTNIPIIHIPPPLPPPSPTTPHPQHSPLPKIDQNRMPLTTHRIPRRNVFVSKFLKYYKKIQRRVPSFVYVTRDKVSSARSLQPPPPHSGYPSWRDFCPPVYPEYDDNGANVTTKDDKWQQYRRLFRCKVGTPTTTVFSHNSDTTLVISNPTSPFC